MKAADWHSSAALARGIRQLELQGLNLFGVLDCQTLPDTVTELIDASVDLSRYARLVVIGNAGRDFWPALQAADITGNNPIDTFSHTATTAFCEHTLAGEAWDIVFPGARSIPLQRIGALLGWGQVSPLGTGISGKYGLWWAYRAALLTSAQLPLPAKAVQHHPCDSCRDKPCIASCPAQAVSGRSGFDVAACFQYRAVKNSPCEDRCLSRYSCPAGAEHQYPEEMTRYIYRYSMKTVRAHTARTK